MISPTDTWIRLTGTTIMQLIGNMQLFVPLFSPWPKLHRSGKPFTSEFFLTIYSFRRNALPHQHKQTYPTLCHPIYIFTRIVFAQNLLYALLPTQRITENEMLNLVELIKSSTILDKFSCRKELKLYKAISDRERNWHPSVIVIGNYLLG